MRKGFFAILTLVIFISSAIGIGALILFPSSRSNKKNKAEPQARIIIPHNMRERSDESVITAELMAHEESITSRVPLADGEVIISVLNSSFDGGPVEDQFIAYRNLLELESPIYLTYIGYDVASRTYKRLWSGQTAASRPGTVSLYTQDLLGDRSVCVLLSGVNSLGEHTLTIFRKNSGQPQGSTSVNNDLFSKIAEFRIDGSIIVMETERPQAYQLGISRGQSFTIAAYGRDFESVNIMDQVEIIYEYNAENGLYEQRNVTRIPGTQIEQRKVRELLGNSQAFEEFITGLWYYVTPGGTIDKRQYIYFSPSSREIIFYGDETQQVFTWQNSTVTRLGLYISSHNISVTTLRRSIDLELETLESIKVKVFEDVRLKIGVNAPWDGSYRKAGPPENQTQKSWLSVDTFIDASYDGSIGKIRFFPNGSYELNAGTTQRQGKYSFFVVNNQEFLELRGEGTSAPVRETFMIEDDVSAKTQDEEEEEPVPQLSLRKSLNLVRVRIGARGIENLYEGTVTLNLSSEKKE